jgi:hypothetical protein
MPMSKGFRQGDVLFVPCKRVKGEKMRPVDGLYTVALGERTGHHHSVRATPDATVLLHRDGMHAQGIGTLAHQEHDPHEYKGDYEIVQQRQASPSDHRVLRPAD